MAVSDIQANSSTSEVKHTSPVINDFSILVATSNGSGSQTSNLVLLRALFTRAQDLGWREACVLTERGNGAATSLYSSVGGVEPTDETVMFSFDLDDPEVRGRTGGATQP